MGRTVSLPKNNLNLICFFVGSQIIFVAPMRNSIAIVDKKPFGVIYKVTNKTNGKIYIGQTIVKLYI